MYHYCLCSLSLTDGYNMLLPNDVCSLVEVISLKFNQSNAVVHHAYIFSASFANFCVKVHEIKEWWNRRGFPPLSGVGGNFLTFRVKIKTECHFMQLSLVPCPQYGE